MIKASVGRYLGELLDDIDGVSMFKIVSAHDNSIAPLVGAMISSEEAETIQSQPDVGSFANIEVYDDMYVRLYFRFNNSEEARYANLRCGEADDKTKCTIDNFKSIILSLVVTKEEILNICNLKT